MSVLRAEETENGPAQLVDVSFDGDAVGDARGSDSVVRRRRRLQRDPDATQQPIDIESVAKRGSAKLAWSGEDILTIQLGLSLALASITDALASRIAAPELRMSETEKEQIAAPATRLVLRHVHVKAAARGDVADSLSLMMAMIAYSARVYAARAEKMEALAANG